MRRKGKTEWNGMQKDKMKWDVNLNSSISFIGESLTNEE